MKLARWVPAILLLAVGIKTFAQQGQVGFPVAPDIVAETRDTLNLSPPQVERLRTLLAGRRKADQAAAANIQAKIDALAAVQEKSPKNSTAIDAATQTLRQAERAQREVNDKFKSDFISLLTPEQKKIFDSINAAAVSVGVLTRLGAIGRGPAAAPAVPPPPPPPAPGGDATRRDSPAPPADPLVPEKVALGKQLFFDTRLSADGTLSCASCHDPERAFSDARPVARGIHGAQGSRNSSALIQAGERRSFFWDGRAPTLERQVLQPILNPKELGLSAEELERKTEMKSGEISEALASYIRTIRSTDSRFDRFVRGDTAALTDLERVGLEIFRGKGRCAGCHSGPDLTDDRFHNTGVAFRRGRFDDEGRFAVTRNEFDHGAFKTPTLREIALTAPYMHDGSMATLEEVVDFYNRGGYRTAFPSFNPFLDARIGPIGLSSGERKALVAFLKTLSGEIHDGL